MSWGLPGPPPGRRVRSGGAPPPWSSEPLGLPSLRGRGDWSLPGVASSGREVSSSLPEVSSSSSTSRRRRHRRLRTIGTRLRPWPAVPPKRNSTPRTCLPCTARGQAPMRVQLWSWISGREGRWELMKLSRHIRLSDSATRLSVSPIITVQLRLCNNFRNISEMKLMTRHGQRPRESRRERPRGLVVAAPRVRGATTRGR